MFKPKLRQQDQGFTLVEVLAAIVIVTVFVATALQAMVVASLFKARARQYAEATTWIQEELETVKQRAAQVGYASLTNDPPVSASSFTVSSILGFVVNDKIRIGETDTQDYIISGVSGSTITISNAGGLKIDHPLNASVFVVSNSAANTLCKANATINGFGNLLNQNLPTLDSTRILSGATYTLTRTSTIKNDAPYEVLELVYEAKEGTKSAAIINNEVIPDVAFRCPQKQSGIHPD